MQTRMKLQTVGTSPIILPGFWDSLKNEGDKLTILLDQPVGEFPGLMNNLRNHASRHAKQNGFYISLHFITNQEIDAYRLSEPRKGKRSRFDAVRSLSVGEMINFKIMKPDLLNMNHDKIDALMRVIGDETLKGKVFKVWCVNVDERSSYRLACVERLNPIESNYGII